MSLDRDAFGDTLGRFGLPTDEIPLNRITSPKFAAFLDAVWPQFVDRTQERCELLIEYLRQEQVLSDEPAAFVDIGWHASLQHCLQKLLVHLGIRKTLEGFYVGTFVRPTGAQGGMARGFLVEADGPPHLSELVRSSPSLIELFHTAGHGTVLGYSRDAHRVRPVLNDNAVEEGQFHDVIAPVQNQAFEFVSEQLRSRPGLGIGAPTSEQIARLALRPIYDPTREEAELFGRLKIATDMGGRMKSLTGIEEWDLRDLQGERLPDGTIPMWRAGFRALRRKSHV
jgi:hypothetical protein